MDQLKELKKENKLLRDNLASANTQKGGLIRKVKQQKRKMDEILQEIQELKKVFLNNFFISKYLRLRGELICFLVALGTQLFLVDMILLLITE